jgi:hypothetical protein
VKEQVGHRNDFHVLLVERYHSISRAKILHHDGIVSDAIVVVFSVENADDQARLEKMDD